MIKKWTDVPHDKLRTIKLGYSALDIVVEGTQIKELVITPFDEAPIRITAGWDHVKVSVPSPPTMIEAWEVITEPLPDAPIVKVYSALVNAEAFRTRLRENLVSDFVVDINKVKVPEDFPFSDEEPTDESL